MAAVASHAAARRSAGAVDTRALADDLRNEIGGEVRFDGGSRALYARDASNYRHLPLGVVIPRTTDDVLAAVAIARRHGVPVLPRGAGTSLAGQSTNAAVVLDFRKHLNRIVELDPEAGLARVQPGVHLDGLRNTAERHHLTFAPDPATHTHCTLGGMIGNNSCGIHSVMGGCTLENVEELDVLTYEGDRFRVGRTGDDELDRIIDEGGRRGEIYRDLRSIRDRYGKLVRARFPDIPRRVSGFALDQLLPERGFHVARALTGSEGTCVTILEATVRLVQSPPGRVLLVLGYPEVYSAADDVPDVLALGPIGLEGMDERLVEDARRSRIGLEAITMLPNGQGWLIAEFGGDDQQEARAKARGAMASLARRDSAPDMRLFDDGTDMRRLWEVRESGLATTAFVPGDPDTWPGWEDSAVAPERLGDYLRDLRALMERHDLEGDFYGHFGQGCVHTRNTFDLYDEDGVPRYRSYIEAAADLVVRYGGSLSGEHGDGQARGELLSRMYGTELVDAFREFKRAWDPEWAMNPGRVVDAAPLDDDLAQRLPHAQSRPPTHFSYPDDEGSFGRATLRCVGVGKCLRTAGGTMCPSYMVLREEKHTTRGRAHLLWEMLQGEAIQDGWRSEEVKESLDLCLACKGCKGDCPVGVDIATYKAEFMAHHYRGRLRPRSAYAFGLIFLWARLAAELPWLVNAAGHAPLLRRLAKLLAGVAPERELPRFSAETFTSWFRRRPGARTNGSVRGRRGRVLLWPDTFTNHFNPEIAQSATAVLEHVGYEVVVPEQSLCCGRPVYEFGMVDLGRGLLRSVLDAIAPELERGTPLVALEPSCLAVFRDELPNLLPDDPRAELVRDRAWTLAELLTHDGIDVPRVEMPAIVQVHCHQGAIIGTNEERQVMARAGLDYSILDSGCCGMAGPFGFEAGEKHTVSVALGERVLLPAVREATGGTLVLADGFSCREQIAQGTSRRALHLAQALHLGLAGTGVDGGTAEGAYKAAREADRGLRLRAPRRVPLAIAAVGSAAAIARFALAPGRGKPKGRS